MAPNKSFCDGELVLEVGTTKEELSVDIWSGNHPFYTGSQELLIQKDVLKNSLVNII